MELTESTQGAPEAGRHSRKQEPGAHGGSLEAARLEAARLEAFIEERVRHLVEQQVGAAVERALAEREARGAVDRAPLPRLLTREDVAEALSCSLRFVDGLIADGVLIPVKIGRLVRFDRDAVAAFIRSSARARRRRERW